MPFIQFFIGENKRYHKLSEEKMTIFGRESHTDFQIVNDGLVSREHFGVEKDQNGHWVLIDLGSRNGTLINDNKIINEIVPLQDSDVIQAGSQIFTFYLERPFKSDNDIFREIEKEAGAGKDYKSMMHEIVDTIKIKKI